MTTDTAEAETVTAPPVAPAPATIQKRPRFSRKRVVLAAAITAALIISGTTATVLTVNRVNAEAEAAAEQAAAELSAAKAESAALGLYLGALEASKAEAAVLVADAAAMATSGSPLLTADDLAVLAALADTLPKAAEAEMDQDADSAAASAAFLELDAAVDVARGQLATVVEHVTGAAQAAHDAYTLADAASLQAIIDGKTAFAGAAANKMPTAEAFTALTASVAAAGASHQTAADLAAAAAAAAASGKKTYTHNGQTYYAGTTTPAVPGTTSPPAPGNPGSPSEAVKSAATKASELAAKYGGSTSVAGACVALNYGHVTGTSSFGPSSTYDGYYSAVSVTSESNPSYVNYYAVQWYACPA